MARLPRVSGREVVKVFGTIIVGRKSAPSFGSGDHHTSRSVPLERLNVTVATHDAHYVNESFCALKENHITADVC